MTNLLPEEIVSLSLLPAVLLLAAGGTIYAWRHRNDNSAQDDGSSYYVG